MNFDDLDQMDTNFNFDDLGDDRNDFLNDQQGATDAPNASSPPQDREDASGDLKEPERQPLGQTPPTVRLEEPPQQLTQTQLAQLNDPNRFGNQVNDISNMSLVQGLTGGKLSPTQRQQCIQVLGYAPLNLLDQSVQRQLVHSGSAHPALAKAFTTGTIRPFAMGVSQASMNICCGFMTIFIARMLLTKTIMQMNVHSSGRKELRQVAKEINENMDSLDKKRHAFVLHVAKICKEMGALSTLLEFGANVDKIVERLTAMNLDLAQTISEVDQANSRTLSKIRSGQEYLLEVLQGSDQFEQMKRNIEELQVETQRKFEAYERTVQEEVEVLNQLNRSQLQQKYARERALKKMELIEHKRPEIEARIQRFEQGIAKYDEMKQRAEADQTAEADLRAFQMQIAEDERKQLSIIDAEDASSRQNFQNSMLELNQYVMESNQRLRSRQEEITRKSDAAKLREEERAQALAKQAKQAAALELKSQISKIDAEAQALTNAIRDKERQSERLRESAKHADNGYRKVVRKSRFLWWSSRSETMEQVLPNQQARLEGQAQTANAEAERLRDRQQSLTASQSRLKSEMIGKMNQIQVEAQQRAQALQHQAQMNVQALAEREDALAKRIQENEARIAAETQDRLDGQRQKTEVILGNARQMIGDRKKQQMLVAQRAYEDAKLRRDEHVDKLKTARVFMVTLRQEAEDARNSLENELQATQTAMLTAEGEMKELEERIKQQKESMTTGTRSIAITKAKNLFEESAQLLETRKNEMKAYTDRLGFVNGMDINALMTSLTQLQFAVERLPLTLETLHNSLETAANTFNSGVFRRDLEDFDDKASRDNFVRALVDRVHAICEVGFQAIDEPARAMMMMNSEAAFSQLQAIAREEAETSKMLEAPNNATVEEA